MYVDYSLLFWMRYTEVKCLLCHFSMNKNMIIHVIWCDWRYSLIFSYDVLQPELDCEFWLSQKQYFFCIEPKQLERRVNKNKNNMLIDESWQVLTFVFFVHCILSYIDCCMTLKSNVQKVTCATYLSLKLLFMSISFIFMLSLMQQHTNSWFSRCGEYQRKLPDRDIVVTYHSIKLYQGWQHLTREPPWLLILMST